VRKSSTHFDIAVQHGIFHSVLQTATAGKAPATRLAPCGKIAFGWRLSSLSCQHLLLNGIAITAHTLPLDNAFAALPPAFYTRLMPTPLPAPILSPPARRQRASWASMRRAWPSRITSSC
jgi:hypothetical protein